MPGRTLGADQGTAATTIGAFLPDYDIGAIEHLVVDVPPAAAYAAARNLDFLRIHSRLTDAAMWVRALPARLRRRVPPRVPTRMTLDDLTTGENWVLLGENPGHEVVFGAVGRFWTPVIRWEDIEPADFAQYDRRGRGKIASSFSVRPYTPGRSIVSYEVRTAFRDSTSRRWFAWYWRTVGPFVRSIMRATLRTIRAETEASTR